MQLLWHSWTTSKFPAFRTKNTHLLRKSIGKQSLSFTQSTKTEKTPQTVLSSSVPSLTCFTKTSTNKNIRNWSNTCISKRKTPFWRFKRFGTPSKNGLIWLLCANNLNKSCAKWISKNNKAEESLMNPNNILDLPVLEILFSRWNATNRNPCVAPNMSVINYAITTSLRLTNGTSPKSRHNCPKGTRHFAK